MFEHSEKAGTAESGGRSLAAATQRLKLIEQAIEELLPYLRAHGGDCELVGVEGDLVKVKLQGACIGCQMSHVTINGLQERLIAKLGMPLRIIPVKAAH
jgi:NifU-like protein